MPLLAVLLRDLAVSMDALCAGVAYGLKGIRVPGRSLLTQRAGHNACSYQSGNYRQAMSETTTVYDDTQETLSLNEIQQMRCYRTVSSVGPGWATAAIMTAAGIGMLMPL